MADRKFQTALSVGIFDGGEHEIALLVTYRFTKAYPQTAIDPGEPATVEIQTVRLISEDGVREFSVPQWLSDLIETDEVFVGSLIADAQEQDLSDQAYAEERRAEDRAERLREGA